MLIVEVIALENYSYADYARRVWKLCTKKTALVNRIRFESTRCHSLLLFLPSHVWNCAWYKKKKIANPFSWLAQFTHNFLAQDSEVNRLRCGITIRYITAHTRLNHICSEMRMRECNRMSFWKRRNGEISHSTTLQCCGDLTISSFSRYVTLPEDSDQSWAWKMIFLDRERLGDFLKFELNRISQWSSINLHFNLRCAINHSWKDFNF